MIKEPTNHDTNQDIWNPFNSWYYPGSFFSRAPRFFNRDYTGRSYGYNNYDGYDDYDGYDYYDYKKNVNKNCYGCKKYRNKGNTQVKFPLYRNGKNWV
jgi:hypothetical protein